MEYLYLKWIDYKTNKKYIIGVLCRDKKTRNYFFKMDANCVNKAEKAGFSQAVLPFSNVEKIYKSDSLFPFFRMRIPIIEKIDKENIEALLEEVGLEEFEEFEFLKKTKGKTAIDSFILEEERE